MYEAEQQPEPWYFTARVVRMKLNGIKIIGALLGATALPVALIALVNMTPNGALPRDAVKYLSMTGTGLFLLLPLILVVFLLTMAVGKQATFCVSGGRLAVGRGAENDFSLAGAKLGLYRTPNGTTRGSALHLLNDRRNFVLGTNDVRMADGRQLEAPPVSRLDAYVASTDFATLLGMVGLGHAPASRTAAAPAKIRCVLFPHISRLSYAVTGIRNRGKPPAASLAIEVDGDIVTVTDAQTNAQLTSAPRSRVTVKPARWQPISIPTILRVPILVVRVPGIRTLSVGLPDVRVRWGKRVPRRLSPRYVASAWDWLTLAEIFGLTSALAEGVPSLADFGDPAP